MKKSFGILLIILFIASCNNATIPKPDNLIPEDKMVDIYYEISMYNAIKSVNSKSLFTRNIDHPQYILKKFEIDSAQLSNSSKYYASNLDLYYNMLEKVEVKLNEFSTINDSLKKIENSKSKSDTTKVNQIKKNQDFDKKRIERREKLKDLKITKN